MDGNKRKVLHNTDLVWPNALTLDIDMQILYWADASLDKIESSNADGLNRKLLTTVGIFHPFAMTSFKGNLYWTDWRLRAILASSDGQQNITILLSGLELQPLAIQVVSEDRQPIGKIYTRYYMETSLFCI